MCVYVQDYFERGDFTERMSEQLSELQDSYTRLEGVWSEGAVYNSVMERLKQAYDSLTERVCGCFLLICVMILT